MRGRIDRPSTNGLGGGSGVVESWPSVQVEHVESSGVGDAIGNYAQELHPSLDIRYVRAAEFGRQFAIAAGDGQQDDLRSLSPATARPADPPSSLTPTRPRIVPGDVTVPARRPWRYVRVRPSRVSSLV